MIVIYNYAKLKGRITERYGTQKAFAEAISKKDPYISRVLKSRTKLSQDDIELWGEALGIDRSEYGIYFFAH